ncbi:hypothetical protein WICPIJ_009053 [Wickerhamomyces pijperi]|uniref:Uncharacterized protein n=1 Tax=Wickerhamomyces pijperi TaxID=599730 RepID=A0A9P8PR22_WICPI|nr:hypothetical protein WICPIJ_009053 [Wickerhamomyces pijperi]
MTFNESWTDLRRTESSEETIWFTLENKAKTSKSDVGLTVAVNLEGNWFKGVIVIKSQYSKSSMLSWKIGSFKLDSSALSHFFTTEESMAFNKLETPTRDSPDKTAYLRYKPNHFSAKSLDWSSSHERYFHCSNRAQINTLTLSTMFDWSRYLYGVLTAREMVSSMTL